MPALIWSIVMFEARRTKSANKRHKPEDMVQKLRQVDVIVGRGMQRADAIREVGILQAGFQTFGSVSAGGRI